MTDVTAQAFREAAAYFAHLAQGERRMKDDLGKRTAADMQRYADLLLAAAEQREQLDRMIEIMADASMRVTGLLDQIDALTAERDQARQLVQTLGDQAERFRRERDHALGRIANALT